MTRLQRCLLSLDRVDCERNHKLRHNVATAGAAPAVKFPRTPRRFAEPTCPSRTGSAHGFELAGVVVVFFLIGFGLDAWFDTKPLFMVVLSLLGVFGLLARAWYDFSTKMNEIEAARRSPRATSSSSKVDEPA